MKKYFIDTNVFLRVFTGDNPKMLTECLVLFEKIKKGKISAVTSGIVISEIVWTLGSFYNFSKDKVTDAVRSILNIPNLEIKDRYSYLKALDMYKKNSVKFIDVLIASIYEVQNKELVILSYDKDFDKLGVKRIEPSDIINRG